MNVLAYRVNNFGIALLGQSRRNILYLGNGRFEDTESRARENTSGPMAEVRRREERRKKKTYTKEEGGPPGSTEPPAAIPGRETPRCRNKQALQHEEVEAVERQARRLPSRRRNTAVRPEVEAEGADVKHVPNPDAPNGVEVELKDVLQGRPISRSGCHFRQRPST